MNADDIWSLYLDSYFSDNMVEAHRALESLQTLPSEEKARLYCMVLDGEKAMESAGQEAIVQIYCDVKGVDTTTKSPSICRAELVTMVAQAKGVLNG